MVIAENFMKFNIMITQKDKEYLYGTKACECELIFADPIDCVPNPNILLSFGKRTVVLSFGEAKNLHGILGFMIESAKSKNSKTGC